MDESKSGPTPAALVTALIVVVGALLGGVATAQIPDEFSNLEILPADIGKRELVGVMRGFTSALGIRCNHCHVGEDPDSLEGYDFASDDKETKRTARVMLQMLREINGTFMPKTGREPRIEVTCETCHRGITKPERVKDMMLAAIEEKGVAGAIGYYRELRGTHYGSGAYDFSPGPLDGVTETLGRAMGDAEGAMAINRLNLELHPDSDYTLYLHSRLLLQVGDRPGAIETLERAIAANPEVGWLKDQLEELTKPADD